jgi:hypothetical protein
MAPETGIPESFSRAVAQLSAVVARPEIVLEEAPAPTKLAPYAYSVGGTVSRHGEEVATGRLVLLHDPSGHEAWDGTMRLVTYVTAELEPEIASDPLLAGVAWSWLTDALEGNHAAYTAIGGTVTGTLSTRFGDLSGPAPVADLEIRASWTPVGTEFGAHMESWCALLASTAGLPPPGVATIERRATATA